MIEVFIENEAGSNQKHLHNEKTLVREQTVTVSRAYPYPYGFILGTTAADGDNVDCFVMTDQALESGTIVRCRPVALLEQVEDGDIDHNVIAVLPGSSVDLDSLSVDTLRDFILNVFSHIPGKTVDVGRLLGKEVAEAHIRSHADG